MELALSLTLFGIVLTVGAFVQNHFLNRQTDKMIQAEDARAKELLAKIENSIAETRNMVAETRNMVAEMQKQGREDAIERRKHEQFMEQLLARIHDKVH